MKNVLIIGAGGVAKAVVHKIVQQSHLFGDINIATRSVDKIESILVDLPNREALKDFFQVNADSTYEVEGLLGITKTDIVINCASPYCNLSILDACIKTGCAYLDSARHEDEDSLNEPPLCYEKYEWTRKALCQENGITALLSLGFDPGVVNAYARHCVDTLDDVISLDIIDINAGSHGKYFATNFDPEINFREFMGDVHYYQDRKWAKAEMFDIKRMDVLPVVGFQESYLTGHEEVHSLSKLLDVATVRFWMGFSNHYINVFNVLKNIGMLSYDVLNINNKLIRPIDVIKALLPNPKDLAENYKGSTFIGVKAKGFKDKVFKEMVVYNTVTHEQAYKDCKSNAISYTAALPLVAGAMLIADGTYDVRKMVNIEELDPKPLMTLLDSLGLKSEVSYSY